MVPMRLEGQETRWVPYLALFIIALLSAYYLASQTVGKHADPLCPRNVSAIGHAIEQYAEQHSGIYPKSLKDLSPAILPVLPKCQSVTWDSYQQGYQTDGHSFQICCAQARKAYQLKMLNSYPVYDSRIHTTRYIR